MARQFWLSDAQWAVLEPLLPHLGGKPRVDDSRVTSGILHWYREGMCWRAVPAEYGPRRRCSIALTVGARRPPGRDCWPHLWPVKTRPTRRWLIARPFARVARPRAQRGQQTEAIEWSRGGPTTKIRALCDGTGRLYALMLTADQVHDIQGGRALLASQGTEPVISPMPRRLTRPPLNKSAYRARNLIERVFCRLKDWRAIATRYDKTARNFLAFRRPSPVS